MVVFDDAVWTGLAADNRYPPCMNPAFVKVVRSSPPTRSTSWLQISMPGEALNATVGSYNAALDNGTADQLSPSRTANVVPALPIRAAPFHAIEVCAGITYTMGIAIDDASRVLMPKTGRSRPLRRISDRRHRRRSKCRLSRRPHQGCDHGRRAANTIANAG